MKLWQALLIVGAVVIGGGLWATHASVPVPVDPRYEFRMLASWPDSGTSP